MTTIIELTLTLRYEESDQPTVGESVNDVRKAVKAIRVSGVDIESVDVDDWDEV